MNEQRVLALELTQGKQPTAEALMRVGGQCGSDAAAWAFKQWELRLRAKSKFQRAEDMLFTDQAQQQASSEVVAGFHASLFPSGALVADLTVGIGADLIALAARGPAIGFECDAERAVYATHNLQVHGLNAEIRVANCLDESWSFDYAFADPSRRVQSRRTLNPEEFEPNIFELSDRMAQLRLGVMKLTPMLKDEMLAKLGKSVRFVSYRSQCLEALLLMGLDARESAASAVHIESGELLESSDRFVESATLRASGWLYDADSAAVRSHCLSALCQQFELQPIGRSNGYLHGANLVECVWLRPYEILHVIKFDRKRLRAVMKSEGYWLEEVKARGMQINAQEELKQLRNTTIGAPVSVCLFPDECGFYACLVRRPTS